MQIFSDLGGDIAGPALGGIEGDDANRITVLAGQQVPDDRFVIRCFRLDLAPNPAESTTEIVHHQIDARLTARNDRWGSTPITNKL